MAGSLALRALDNVHAKVWVLDQELAIVSSGNATTSGLDYNVEYGIALRERLVVERILSDWNASWRRAEPITTEMLGVFRRYLELLSADQHLHELQGEIAQRTTDLAQQMGVPSRFGSVHGPSVSNRGSNSRLSLPPRSPAPSASHNEPSVSGWAARSPDSGLPLELNLRHLWQAIQWVVPGKDIEQSYAAQLALFSALKLTCEPKDVVDRAEYGKTVWLDLIRFIWADSSREVTATIPAFTRPVDNEPPVREPWAVTLNAVAIQGLLEALNTYAPANSPGDAPYIKVRLQKAFPDT